MVMTSEQIKLMRWSIELAINVLGDTPSSKMPEETAADLIYALNALDGSVYEQVKDDL